MKIEMGKKYKTRTGQDVRILCTDRNDLSYPVVGLLSHYRIVLWRADGKCDYDTSTSLDLVEASPWEDFKINEKVMVRSYASSPWRKRYFAGTHSDGGPMAYSEGGTSWSACEVTTWDECRRPTEEELK